MSETDRDTKGRVVILGAGVSGLTTGWKRAERGCSGTLLEKNDTVGGLARSSKRNGCSFDYGPHQLYTSFDDVRDDWKELLSDDLLLCTKEARVRFRGKILRYPLSTSDILHNIPLTLSAKCFLEFAGHNLFGKKREVKSFEDWVVSRFGRTLFDIHFGPYTEKVWGIPPNRLTADAAEKRIAVQNLWDILRKTFSKQKAQFTIKTKVIIRLTRRSFSIRARGSNSSSIASSSASPTGAVPRERG